MQRLAPDGPVSLADEEFVSLDASGAAICGRRMEDCVFRSCRLVGAVLADCRLTGCTFEDCELSALRLDGSHVHETRFLRCKLRAVDWRAAAGLRGVVFEDCVLDECGFAELELAELVARRCSLRDAVLQGARLRKADLRASDLRGATFTGADLRGADLRDATGYALDPTLTKLAGARVSLPDALTILDALGLRVECG